MVVVEFKAMNLQVKKQERNKEKLLANTEWLVTSLVLLLLDT